MEKMQYKTFIWPVNPETYREEAQRQPQYEKDRYDVQVFQGLGPVKRVITGGGAFSGPEAYESFSQLAALLDQADSGVLTHPVWGERSVFFTGLEMTQEPRENYVAYRFEFQQADENGKIPY